MPISLTCPSCGVNLRVPDDRIGRKTKCPKCHLTFTVPSPAETVHRENPPRRRIKPKETVAIAEPKSNEPSDNEKPPSMPYVEHSLVAGERIVHFGRLHWAIFLPAAFSALPVIAFLLIWLIMELSSGGRERFQFLVLGVFLVIALVFAVAALIQKRTMELAVTNQRVIMKAGLISRRTIEMDLARIENVQVDQSVFGRLFGCGTITVVGTGGSRERFAYIVDPLTFRRAVLKAVRTHHEYR
jgi:membrane protein YdbS with pleckstrin-like domain